VELMAFNVRKAAQVAAFLIQERGGTADIIEVVKLAYLADRRFMELYDLPILYDDFYSMEHGPVDSVTYNYLKGEARNERHIWNYYLKDREKNTIALTHDLSLDDFDELSNAEIYVLKEISEQFARYRRFELVDYVHKHCPEWEDVGPGTSQYLPYDRVFQALEKENSEGLSERVVELRHLQGALARAR